MNGYLHIFKLDKESFSVTNFAFTGRTTSQVFYAGIQFRVIPMNEAAIILAENGKVGALNLLFKCHPPFMLDNLAAIPETIPVQTYVQLLPGRSPVSIAMREEDWVECDKMVNFINKLHENRDIGNQIRTEHVVKQLLGSFWPSIDELAVWYKHRARDMDSHSGLLDNCLCLVGFACQKDIYELKQFHEDISYLHQLVYGDENDSEISSSMSLIAWEQLSDYKKFRTMLMGAKRKMWLNYCKIRQFHLCKKGPTLLPRLLESRL